MTRAYSDVDSRGRRSIHQLSEQEFVLLMDLIRQAHQKGTHNADFIVAVMKENRIPFSEYNKVVRVPEHEQQMLENLYIALIK